VNAVLTLLAGTLVASLAGWWSMRSVEGSARVAIVAVLGVTAAAFNVVVPIPSVEATTTIVLCTALALGARTGTAAGLVAVIASSVTGGVGTWTIWQLAAVALIALVGSALGRTGPWADWFAPARMLGLAAAGAIAAAISDLVTTAGSISAYAPPGGGSLEHQVIGAMLIGAAFTVTHMVFSALFTAVAGPSLLHALGRARPRLDGGVVLAG
jgi:energy-coupling factor transport system substrate-specific component